MDRLLRLTVWFLLALSLAYGQPAVVTRNFTLRPDPSTDNDPIGNVQPRTQVELLEPDPTDGFFRVKANGQTGWVWGKRIRIEPQADSTPPTQTPPTQPSPTLLPATGEVLFSKLTAARQPAVGQPLVENGTEVCGPTGDATDGTRKSLNTNKNRTDVPEQGAYVEIIWDDLSNLPSD